MRKQKNKYLAEIDVRFAQPDYRRALHLLASEHRARGQTLEEVAKSLGASAITTEKLPFDGGVFSDGNAFTIKLNVRSIPTRQRFTLAHEIAHLIFQPGQAARRCLRSSDLEKACDALAAELLMPLDDVGKLIPKTASTGAVVDVARAFDVSLHAAAVRAKEVGDWRESIGFWERDRGDTVKELWFVGKRLWPEKRVTLTAFNLVAEKRGTIRMIQQYSNLGQGVSMCHIEARSLGLKHVLAVLSP